VTIYGWDASDFDWERGPMDLGAARRSGISFFTHKATEATSTRHVHYGEALNRAKAAGVPFLGAYHVVRSSPSIASQVAYLLDYVNAATPWWKTFPGFFWQVDLEIWGYDQVPASAGVAFAAELARQTGRGLFLYASRGQYGDSLGGSSALWNASYGGNAAGNFKSIYPGDSSGGWSKYSGRVPDILQYGSRAIIGSQSTCDANAFRGTESDFARRIGATDMALDATSDKAAFYALMDAYHTDRTQNYKAMQYALNQGIANTSVDTLGTVQQLFKALQNFLGTNVKPSDRETPDATLKDLATSLAALNGKLDPKALATAIAAQLPPSSAVTTDQLETALHNVFTKGFGQSTV
jgi:hypothetical protein